MGPARFGFTVLLGELQRLAQVAAFTGQARAQAEEIGLLLGLLLAKMANALAAHHGQQGLELGQLAAKPLETVMRSRSFVHPVSLPD
ncbi:MAG: hypothetical protein RIS48_893 [Pseudomonadota bacterium]|jgi:hypothetical protein